MIIELFFAAGVFHCWLFWLWGSILLHIGTRDGTVEGRTAGNEEIPSQERFLLLILLFAEQEVYMCLFNLPNILLHVKRSIEAHWIFIFLSFLSFPPKIFFPPTFDRNWNAGPGLRRPLWVWRSIFFTFPSMSSHF